MACLKGSGWRLKGSAGASPGGDMGMILDRKKELEAIQRNNAQEIVNFLTSSLCLVSLYCLCLFLSLFFHSLQQIPQLFPFLFIAEEFIGFRGFPVFIHFYLIWDILVWAQCRCIEIGCDLFN